MVDRVRKPGWQSLEGRIRLHLAQAHSNKAPRGRKRDFTDAERLVRRHIAGELILSFVPDSEQRLWRMLTRTQEGEATSKRSGRWRTEFAESQGRSCTKQ